MYFDGAGAQRVYVSPAEKLVIVRLGAGVFEAYLAGLFGDWRRLPPPDQRRPGHVTAADFGVHQ